LISREKSNPTPVEFEADGEVSLEDLLIHCRLFSIRGCFSVNGT
jgi:hypothetical protein